MNRLMKVITVLCVSFISHLCAAQCPSIYPEPVKQFLAINPQWKVLDLHNLEDDDQQLWQQYHAGRCPGMAYGNFTGTGDTSYAIALIKPDKIGYTEKLISAISEPENLYACHNSACNACGRPICSLANTARKIAKLGSHNQSTGSVRFIHLRKDGSQAQFNIISYTASCDPC